MEASVKFTNNEVLYNYIVSGWPHTHTGGPSMNKEPLSKMLESSIVWRTGQTHDSLNTTLTLNEDVAYILT